MSILNLPELVGLESSRGLIRIPDEINVPTTPRIRRLIDTGPFRQLSRISQLGLVSLVYPAANHSRFEHSLGVYRNALLYVQQLMHDRAFTERVDERGVERLLVAALLHDLGHWPFCHPIEDMDLQQIPRHEELAQRLIVESELADLLQDDWQMCPADVVSLLGKTHESPADRLLANLLSGPIDIDKMDYLYRDSLHAGVPYGRHFDRGRLMGSLCINREGNGLAITAKGKTAAELMVFARYVMFSEVYWHHAVRSATAMLQRAFYELRSELDLERLFQLNEFEFQNELLGVAQGRPQAVLVDGIFGERRRLYKRVIGFSCLEEPDLFRRLSRRPYPWLVEFSNRLAEQLSQRLGISISEGELLIDAPPVGLEVEFDIQILSTKTREFRDLRELSPVIQSLADRQFDDYVKRVRIFADPKWTQQLADSHNLRDDVRQVLDGSPG